MKTGWLRFLFLGLLSCSANGYTVIPSGSDEDRSAITMHNKGALLHDKGDYAGARQCYDAALRKNPNAWLTYHSRAEVFMHEKEWKLALQDLNACIKLKPSFLLAFITRAKVNAVLGNCKSSLADLDQIIALHPAQATHAATLSTRAWVRATCADPALRNGQQAVADAKAACNINGWSKGDYIDTLAAAYAEAGDFDSAVRFEEKAIPKFHAADDKAMAERHLAMYRQHQSLRAH